MTPEEPCAYRHCKKIFTPKRNDQRFCSQRCREAYAYDVRRADMASSKSRAITSSSSTIRARRRRGGECWAISTLRSVVLRSKRPKSSFVPLRAPYFDKSLGLLVRQQHKAAWRCRWSNLMMFLFRSQMLYRVEQWDDKDRLAKS